MSGGWLAYLLRGASDEGMAVLDAGVALGFPSKEGKLTIVRVTRRIRYPLQGMGHIYTLQPKTVL